MILIIPKSSAPVVVVVKHQAPKRDLPANQEPCEEPKHPGRRLKLASAASAFGPKRKDLADKYNKSLGNKNGPFGG